MKSRFRLCWNETDGSMRLRFELSHQMRMLWHGRRPQVEFCKADTLSLSHTHTRRPSIISPHSSLDGELKLDVHDSSVQFLKDTMSKTAATPIRTCGRSCKVKLRFRNRRHWLQNGSSVDVDISIITLVERGVAVLPVARRVFELVKMYPSVHVRRHSFQHEPSRSTFEWRRERKVFRLTWRNCQQKLN